MTQIPVESEPGETTEEQKSEQKSDMKAERTWIEEIEVAGGQLVERIKELVAEGNVRRLIIRSPDDKVILEIPLTAGAVVGGMVTIIAPLLAALGALAALIAKVKVQVVRVEDQNKE
jgi:hypothetical protein